MLQEVKICIWGWGQEFARPVRAGQEDGVEKREPEQDRKSVSRATPYNGGLVLITSQLDVDWVAVAWLAFEH